MAQADHDFNTVKPDIPPLPAAEANRSSAHRPGIWRQRNMPRKIPTGYYVYTISVDDVVRYIGKGKWGLDSRSYSAITSPVPTKLSSGMLCTPGQVINDYSNGFRSPIIVGMNSDTVG